VLRASEDVESGFARAQAEGRHADAMALRRDTLADAARRADAALAKGGLSRNAYLATTAALAVAEADLASTHSRTGRAAIAVQRGWRIDGSAVPAQVRLASL